MAFLTSLQPPGTTAYIKGEGVFSCANTTIISSEECICTGANSCSSSNIQSPLLQCKAHQSCAFASIGKTQLVYGDGSYSLYKATIDTQNINNSTNVSIKLYGDYAAYGATLTCRSGHTCNISCYGYNSC
eukprot:223786_1